MHLFRPLGESKLASLMNQGLVQFVNHRRGSVIHSEGDRCDYLEIILTGRAKVERIGIDGSLMTIAVCNRNEVLGGNLLFSAQPVYPMTIMAQTDVELIRIERESLFRLMAASQPFLRAFLELISERANLLGNQIRQDTNRPLRDRLLDFILDEYRKQKTNPIRLPISKKLLAEKCGVQRTSVSRELAKMRLEGLIHYDKDSITLDAIETIERLV